MKTEGRDPGVNLVLTGSLIFGNTTPYECADLEDHDLIDGFLDEPLIEPLDESPRLCENEIQVCDSFTNCFSHSQPATALNSLKRQSSIIARDNALRNIHSNLNHSYKDMQKIVIEQLNRPEKHYNDLKDLGSGTNAARSSVGLLLYVDSSQSLSVADF
ncbi:hypothetical protein KSP39_PZI016664 [Platanthera zijinensis]|uniref:Uncharacterized protein n=1 Tax=Platanthera zijinensis TaxID=2320716 RepID=A0AAP0G0Q4_9ASPA